MTTFWWIFYAFLVALDLSGIATTIFRMYCSYKISKSVGQANITLLALWTVSFVLCIMGFVLRLRS